MQLDEKERMKKQWIGLQGLPSGKKINLRDIRHIYQEMDEDIALMSSIDDQDSEDVDDGLLESLPQALLTSQHSVGETATS